MARVKFSGLITSINGSSGGTTFQRNAYGMTLKNKPNMPIPRSSFQNNQKLIIAGVTSYWRKLTNPQRQSWTNYANTFPTPSRLNPDSYLNGFNLFVKYNCVRSLFSPFLLESVSQVQSAISIVGISIDFEAGNFRLLIDAPVFDGNWLLFVFMSPSIQSFTNARTNQTRFIQAVAVDELSLVQVIGTVYANRMGEALVVGRSYYVDITFINSLSGQILEIPTSVVTVEL